MCSEIVTWWETNWLTIVSIILSGFISLVISAAFYHKGNRNNLQMSFVFPATRLLKENRSPKVYKELCELNDSYVTRYLKKRERECWLKILPAYKDIMNHTETGEKVDSIISYFEYKLKINQIDPKPVPMEYEGEVMYYDYPDDIHYLIDAVEKEISGYYLDEELLEQSGLEDRLKSILKYYAKECYGNDKLEFFDDFSLYKVLSLSKVKKEWKNKYDYLDKTISDFQKLKVVKKCIDDL